MDGEFTYDVVLSHSSKDKAVVCALAARLRKDGLNVWFDEWVLKPGDSIPAKIEEGLERSRVLVLCVSANAFGSDWAQLESHTFRFRDPLNKERRFLPLRLDDAPIKGSLAQFLYINWLPPVREQEYTKLLEACRPLVELPVGIKHRAEESVQLHYKTLFSVVVDTCIMSKSRESGTSWFLVCDPKDGPACPIFFIMFIKVTNLSSEAVRIDSYSVETEVKAGIWETAVPMFVDGTDVVYALSGDRSKGLRIDFSTELFNTFVGSETILPGGTVQGWIFLDAPKGGRGDNFRFRSIDASGRESVQPMTFSKEKKGMLHVGSASFTKRGEVDIGLLPMEFYSDFAHHAKSPDSQKSPEIP